MLMSKGQEVAMGQQSDPEIINYFGLYEDKSLQRFIEEKGQQMAAVSHRKDLKYQFKIVDSPVVNAFAVPGGYVYFTRGIMAHFNNEAEFAGVLGHEIGHVTARHSAKQYSKAMLAQVGLVAGMIVSPEFAQYADVAQQGLSLLFLKFGRDDERQSDKLGVEYSTKIGYDAQEMADFFQTLDRISKQSGAEEAPDFLSTHPNPQDRYRDVQKLATDWKKKTDATSLKVNRNSYLKMIDGIIYGDDPKQGFVENNVFYHPVLKFQFPIPPTWAFQNTPQQVQMAPKEGDAMMAMTLAQGQSLEAAAQSLVQNNQLTVIESKQENVNGLPAIAIIAQPQPQQQQGQQQQQDVRALIYLIQYGENIYQMMGITSTTNFNNYFNTFNTVITNFRKLNDPEKINRKPDRIRIKSVKRNGTLAQALADLKVHQDKIQELAILNGMQPEDKVESGMLVKVLEK
ncbi:M48 family metalloprotease [Rhodocytophaga rosea]|uniref:M48 family metalloprotease n=2 Tax=Rhodocytophaga rosea TaxID=2704465 RepID=A0A6C0GVJ4_9BACT|nr:M48 family metalloprotease [Rhodocytophaga rosea]